MCDRVARWMSAKHHTVVQIHPHAQITINKTINMTKDFKVVHTGTMESHKDILRPKHSHVLVKFIKKMLKKKQK